MSERQSWQELPTCRRLGGLIAVLVCGLALGAAAHRSQAGDWPQILGPQRNGAAAADERLSPTWPAAGPDVTWQRAVGSGVAGAAVARGQVILFHRSGGEEIVEALSAKDGSPRWKSAAPTDFAPQYGSDDGPLCVPTIDGQRVITFGAQGVLSCHDLESGERLWSHATHAEFGAREGYFGAGSSPIVVGGKVIVNVGGREREAGVVAFDLPTGNVVWKAIADEASYSSPVLATVGGKPQVILLTRYKCAAISPADGKVGFEFPYGLRGPTVTAANPVVLGDYLFLSASYGIGAVWGRLTAGGFKEAWSSNDLLSSQYTTCVEHDGKLIGIDGRQDIPPAALKCIDPRTQKELWSAPNFGYATIIKADDKLLIARTDGTIVLAELRTDAYKPLAQAQVFGGVMRALPALADGRLYVRDARALKCLNVGAAPAGGAAP